MKVIDKEIFKSAVVYCFEHVTCSECPLHRMEYVKDTEDIIERLKEIYEDEGKEEMMKSIDNLYEHGESEHLPSMKEEE